MLIKIFIPAVDYCPACGSTSIEREGSAMEGCYHYNRYYCQSCGTIFRVLQKWDRKKICAMCGKEVEEFCHDSLCLECCKERQKEEDVMYPPDPPEEKIFEGDESPEGEPRAFD